MLQILKRIFKNNGFVAQTIIIGSFILAVGILGGLVVTTVNASSITKETLLSMLNDALADDVIDASETQSLLSALDLFLSASNEVTTPSISNIETFSHTGSSAGDAGSVILPKKQLPLLKTKLFNIAEAAEAEITRILAYVKADPNGIDQVYYYNLTTGESVQVTNESVPVKNVLRVVDYPVSGIIYITGNGIKLIRLIDSSVISIPGFTVTEYAISPDGKLAYFDNSYNLIVRDLLLSNLDIIKNFPTPLKGSSKGAISSPLVFSADGSKLYLDKPFVVNGYGKDAIVSLNVNDGSINELVADNSQKRPPIVIDDKLYYKEYAISTEGNPMGSISSGNLVVVDLNSGNKEIIEQGVDITVFKGFSNNMIIFEGDSYRDGTTLISHIDYKYYNLANRQYGQEIKFEKQGVVEFIGFGNSEKELIFANWGSGDEQEQVIDGIARIPAPIFSYNIDSGIFKDLFINVIKVNQADRG